MAVAARRKSPFLVYLEMIKIEHSIFALPFAMIGMMWGSLSARHTPWPGWGVFLWIVIAMISCRSAAMAFNRIADRDIDALNPRTKSRALPSGLIRLAHAYLFFMASCLLFFLAAGMLNRLTLLLSPVALFVTLFYSKTKRFTSLSHFVLGLSLGIAPSAAWIGASGSLSWAIVPVTLAVALWTAGFDLIYSLQDVDFDLEQGLRSLPETIGVARALLISRVCHGWAIALLAFAGYLVHAGPVFFGGVAVAAGLLAYEQSLVKPTDLSKVNIAFMNMNGFVSVGLFAFALADALVRKG